jgi:hypothetical protein
VPRVVRPGTGVREWWEDRLGLDLVTAAERADPEERAGSRLLEDPAVPLEGVVVAARGSQVGGDGLAALLVCDGVVLVAVGRGAATADADAGAVADLGVAA